MRENDTMIVNMMRGMFIFSLLLISWVIAKIVLLKGDIFDFSWDGMIAKATLSIYVNAAVGLFLLQFSLKELITYKKTGTIEHGADERNAKILYYSTMNAGMAVVFVLYGVILVNSLFNGLNDAIFSLANLSHIMIPGLVVWFYCFYWYYPKKKLI